jgi:ATP-dependent RNA helicase DeaD
MLAPENDLRDLLVSAQTGSGKTVAFGLALAPSLLGGELRLPKAEEPMALIIAPTRELAVQVTKELEWLYGEAGGRIASCIGGMDMRDERRALERGVHIVVGTPGRLVDHIKRGSLNMDYLKAVVLDEADEMLNMGFREELEEILEAAPEDRRTLMFSATVSKQIANLAQNYQDNALRLNTVSAREQHIDIEYKAVVVEQNDVEKAIINLLLLYDAPNALVFCARREGVNKLTARLTNRGFAVVALSGEFSQKERSNSLLAMRDGRARVCVATDVAARGIDLPGLDLVIHADIPSNREGLLHRSGRTGRAGRKGVSALIVPVRARRRTERLLQDAGVSANWGTAPTREDIQRSLDEKTLQHPAFEGGIKESEQELVDALVARFDPHQLALAVTRLARSKQSTPEDLQEVSAEPPRRDKRERSFDPDDSFSRRERPERGPRGAPRQPEFQDSKWVSLGVGRNKNADPKWLVPMLCKSGGFQRSSIGVIHITPTVTHVELRPDAAAQLMENAGEKQVIDKSLYVDWSNGPTDGDDAGERPARSRRPEGRPAGRRSEGRSDGRPDRKPYAKDRSGPPAARRDDADARPPRARPATGYRDEDTGDWTTVPKKSGAKKTGPKKPRGPNGEKIRTAKRPKKAD